MHTTWLRSALLACLLALAPGSPALEAQGPPAPALVPAVPAPEGEVAALSSAPVVVDGIDLFHVVGARLYPAEARARAVAERIEALAANPAFDPATLTTRESGSMTDVIANGRIVLRLLDADAELEGLSRALLSEIVVSRVREAIVRHRTDRRPRALLLSAAVVAAWAIALALVLWGTHRLLARLRAGIERRYKARMRDVRIQSFSLLRVDQMWRMLAALLRGAWVVGALVAGLVYLRFALERFPWTRASGLSLAEAEMRPLQLLTSGLVAAVPSLIFLGILVVLTRFLLKLTRLFFEGISGGRIVLSGFEADWAQPTYRLVRFAMIALAAVVAYPYIPGSSSDAFKGVSLFLGVILSLGSSSIVGNTLAGFGMTYRRAFREGDVVKIGEHVGEVLKIRTLVTHLRTLKNEEVTVPNSLILGANVLNYSALAAADGLILHTTVGIGYETPWRQVHAMLLEAAARVRVPGLKTAPAPFVLQQALADFCVTYELNVHCDQPKHMLDLFSALHENVLDVFNEYGVQIMTPAYMMDPARPKVVPRSEWYAAPAGPEQV
jgi:small-conductance mechanosensitive channel